LQLTEKSRPEFQNLQEVEKELQWFFKTAWNLGGYYGERREHKLALEYFELANKVCFLPHLLYPKLFQFRTNSNEPSF